eukprot:7871917-Pyramimonas_sp.AAC.1
MTYRFEAKPIARAMPVCARGCASQRPLPVDFIALAVSAVRPIRFTQNHDLKQRQDTYQVGGQQDLGTVVHE